MKKWLFHQKGKGIGVPPCAMITGLVALGDRGTVCVTHAF